LKALLLDALGTLVALEPPAPRLRRNLAERCGIEISGAEAEAAIDAEIGYYRAHLGEGRDPESLTDLRRRCARTMGEALPAAARALPLDTLLELLLASLEFRAYPDAAPALTTGRDQGVTSVVVSNWDISLRDVLARVGLAPLLDAIVVSAEVGARKPAPVIFERALRLAAVSPGEAIHVGDSLVEDVDGARAAGIEPVLIARDGRPGPPGVRTIGSLSELFQPFGRGWPTGEGD
jgi:putative hydrolase of the HAD superfamily